MTRIATRKSAVALTDANVELVERACKRIQLYLEAIRNSIEWHPEGPVINFDSDALGQLLTPHKKHSYYSGILWHSVLQAKKMGDVRRGSTSEKRKGSSPSAFSRPLPRVQIPSGSRKELQDYCRKLLVDLEETMHGSEATKLGLEIEDWIRLLSEDIVSSDHLGRLLQEVGDISSSLGLLNKLLNYAEFSRLPKPALLADARFKAYLKQMRSQRPGSEKAKNNTNDAINLTETSELREQGFNAYLVTTTAAVLKTEHTFAKDPFYLALEFTVRSHFRHIENKVAIDRINLMTGRLADFVVSIHEYSQVASLSATAPDRKTHRDIQQEASLLANALAAYGDDPILREITSLLSDAASAVRSAYEQSFPDSAGNSLPPDIAMLSQLESVINRLRRRVGNIPSVQLKRNQLTSSHFSYSLLDPEGKLLLAADRYGDDLAIAWATDLTISSFLTLICSYPKQTSLADMKVLIKMAGIGDPKEFPVASFDSLHREVFNAAGDSKISLLKIVFGNFMFWYDSSVLYAFDKPEETAKPESGKIAVSLGDKSQVDNLATFYMESTINPCSFIEAKRNLDKLLKGY